MTSAELKALFKSFSIHPIAFHKVYAEITGSIYAGLLLSQSVFWSFTTKDEDGWFWKTRDQWQEETMLGRDAQESARKACRDLGVLEEQKRGVPAKLYFRVNFEKLQELIIERERVHPHKQATPTVQSDGNPSNKDAGIPSSIPYIETTSETTTENTDPCSISNLEGNQNQGEEPVCSACGDVGVHRCPGPARNTSRRDRRLEERREARQASLKKAKPEPNHLAHELWKDLRKQFRRQTGRSLGSIGGSVADKFVGAVEAHGGEAVEKAFAVWLETEKHFLKDVRSPALRFVYSVEEWVSDATEPVNVEDPDDPTRHMQRTTEGRKLLEKYS